MANLPMETREALSDRHIWDVDGGFRTRHNR